MKKEATKKEYSTIIEKNKKEIKRLINRLTRNEIHNILSSLN